MKAQFGSVTRESDVCVLCGQRPATTGEHIPPRSLFIKRPEQYLVVPACEECNQSTKLDDEYLRQVMSASSWTPEGLEVWSRKVAAKFNDYPATKAGLRNQLDEIPIELPNLGEVPVRVLLADEERINRVARKMVRGLYWFHTGELLGQDVPISLQMLNNVQVYELLNSPEQMEVLRKTAMGVYRDPEVSRTFFYQAAVSPDRCRKV